MIHSRFRVKRITEMREKKDNKNSNGNGRMLWKPGNMVYPVPAVMVTAADREGKSNIITIAWTGTVCTNPPMAYISVRPERYSYGMLKETGEFVINLTTEKLVRATDYCGVKSGRDTDKWKETGLTPIPAQEVNVPLIKESPVNIECRVSEIRELGSHHMFLARVVAVDVDEAYLNEQGRFELQKAAPIVYSHGEYYGLSSLLGTFGYSVRKKTVPARGNKKRPGGKYER
jgi:flavin reductase (DIM6/NTAB) family NADH-FMN oxidoreductase RutF